MGASSKRLTYAALSTALSVCCMVAAQFVPMQAPLFVCAICFYIVLDKCGVMYGLLSIASSILIIFLGGFFITGVTVSAIFAPYAIIAFSLRRLGYVKPWHIAIRMLVAVVFGNLVLLGIYYFSSWLVPDIDIDKAIDLLGGYFFLALFVSLFFMVTDFFFRQFCLIFQKMIK